MIKTSHLCVPKFAGATVFLLYVLYAIWTPESPHLIDTVNLIFHEAGHTLLPFLGEIVHAAAGSLFQIMIPLVCAIAFLRKWDLYSVGLMLMWMGQSTAGVARYAGDAINMQLELLGGEASIHDWRFILETLDILTWTYYISYAFYGLALLLIVYGAALAMRESITVCEIPDVV
jgi:hypothetical protein